MEKRADSRTNAPIIPTHVYDNPPAFHLQSGGAAARLVLSALGGVAVCQGLNDDTSGRVSQSPSQQHPNASIAAAHGSFSHGFPISPLGPHNTQGGRGIRWWNRNAILGPSLCEELARGSVMSTASCQGAGVGAETLAARGAAATATTAAAQAGGHGIQTHLSQLSAASGNPSEGGDAHPHNQHQHHHHHHQQHDPPPNSTLGFAEDATVDEEEKLKPAPRLTAASIIKSLIAGGVAGGVSRTAVAPLERLKILQQVQGAHGGASQYTGMWQGLKKIWAQEGFNGLFKGNGVNCARIVPNSAVKFFAYEEASQALLWVVRENSKDPDAELTPLLRLGAGATAGIIAMSATYPMDMVRGRLTVQADGASRQYKNMFHALTTVVKEEGPTALYRGWLPSVIGVVPYVGLNFAVYETLKDWLSKHYIKQQRLQVQQGEAVLSKDAELSVVTKLACGAFAGTIGQTVAYPLDVVRRRLQMVGWKNASPVLTADGRVAVAPQYTGMMDAFRKTVKTEGVGALYRGLLPNSVKVVPSIAIAFVTYEVMKDMLGVEIRISD